MRGEKKKRKNAASLFFYPLILPLALALLRLLGDQRAVKGERGRREGKKKKKGKPKPRLSSELLLRPNTAVIGDEMRRFVREPSPMSRAGERGGGKRKERGGGEKKKKKAHQISGVRGLMPTALLWVGSPKHLRISSPITAVWGRSKERREREEGKERVSKLGGRHHALLPLYRALIAWRRSTSSAAAGCRDKKRGGRKKKKRRGGNLALSSSLHPRRR